MRKNIFYTLVAVLLLTGCGDKDGSDMLDSAKEAASNVVDKTKEVASGAVDSAKEAASGAVEATKNATSNVVDKAKDVASDATQAVKDTTSKAVESTKEVASDVADKAKEVASTAVVATTEAVSGSGCSDLKIDFTFYGAADKSYVVTKNTFKDITSTFNGGKLEGATVEINLLSLDTLADLSNGKAKWPAAMATVRDNNTKNAFFKKMTKDMGKATAKVVKVDGTNAEVEITMNGITEKITMAMKTDGDTTTASGKLDVAKFSAPGWASFSKICKGFHKGMSHSEIDLNFSVPASCK